MTKGFWIIIGVIVAIFAGILLFKGDSTAPGGSQPTNHVTGNMESSVTLVEYADYECPFCGQFYPIVKEVIAQYQDRIKFQYRNLPLTSIHNNALAAARAAEAADNQGKFWEMNDLLFQNQSAWSNVSDAVPVFEQYALQLGLNIEQYRSDFASSAVNDRINADIAEFKKTGQQMSTPTFFLNGQKIEPKSLDDFSRLLDEALAQQN